MKKGPLSLGALVLEEFSLSLSLICSLCFVTCCQHKALVSIVVDQVDFNKNSIFLVLLWKEEEGRCNGCKIWCSNVKCKQFLLCIIVSSS